MSNVFISGTKDQLYWIVGKFPNFKITTTRPKGKSVMEPFNSEEAAERGRRNLYSSIIYYAIDLKDKKDAGEKLTVDEKKFLANYKRSLK
jgi:hypothetical protein